MQGLNYITVQLICARTRTPPYTHTHTHTHNEDGLADALDMHADALAEIVKVHTCTDDDFYLLFLFLFYIEYIYKQPLSLCGQCC